MIKKCLFLCLMLLSGLTWGQSKEVPRSFCISETENKLYVMINEYRARFNLPPIPLSRSLCYVASMHVKDLVTNHPDVNGCNSHSWSNKGKWKPFCYPKDENKQNSVWNKPMELTAYKSKAFEIIYWESEDALIDSVMMMWKSVDYFNNFLTNTGKWDGKKWNAIGIAVYQNYASAWFGELPDVAGSPKICGAPEEAEPAEVTPPSVQPQPVVKAEKPSKKKPEVKEVKQVKADTDTVVSPGVSMETTPMKMGIYYIITLSNQPQKVMQKALNDALSKGFNDAKIIQGDKKRLSLAEFRLKAEADSALRVIRKTHRDAWILIK
ncbi:MAG: CAP domain-containing protein [Syntrophothermus sp.]